ncbi:nuclear transport factor 2 family protein [Paraburkholderia sediminicola]|uniref:nuclear transport factor 2 family protein n=1 Tax=Paraburkholderia sediminicola TaxID=458836 RepID=UPI0038BD1C96
MAALANPDHVTLDKPLDDSFVETAPNGIRRSKSDLLLASPPPSGSTQTLIDVDVRVNGDTAVVTGTNLFKLNPAARPVDYSFTDVFVRKSEDWRVMPVQMVRRWENKCGLHATVNDFRAIGDTICSCLLVYWVDRIGRCVSGHQQ